MVSALGQNRLGERHYGLDWLRIAAFLLLIFYHSALCFLPGHWLVKLSPGIEGAVLPTLAVQPWRMPLLFAISGYASWALLARKGDVGPFLRARTLRLLLPLLFGMAILVPPQTWIGLVENHDYAAGLLHFWARDWFRFGTFDGVFLPAQEHLWFLAYLWTYTMVLGLALVLWPARCSARLGRFFRWIGEGRRLLWAPLVPLLFLRIGLLFTVPERHGLFHDWVSDLISVPAFLFGFALAARPDLWNAVHRARLASALLFAIAFLTLAAIELRYPGAVARPHAVQALDRDAGAAMAWSAILLLFGLAQRLFNRDHPLRARLSEAVFPFYLVHQTIIVAVAWSLKGSTLPPALLYLLLIATTFAGCAAFYALALRSGPLRPLLGLSPLRRSSRPAVAAALEPA